MYNFRVPFDSNECTPKLNFFSRDQCKREKIEYETKREKTARQNAKPLRKENENQQQKK